VEVITTHLNADFDAFASMVAAKKLYPDAAVCFPGSQGKNVRDFFIESTLYILSIERAKDIDLDKITRLILVDTRQKSRIGRFASVAEAGKAEIHIYDHHPASEDDVKGGVEIIEEIGATVSILIREIKKRGIELNAEEATVLALGIYEDTGSFTFPSTTSADMEAAAWLLSKGANLNIISNMMTADLNKDQIEVLHQLIHEAETLNIGGIEIVVTTATAENYVGDLALLVHKFKDMENIDALFALVRMEDRVHLIGRSAIVEVNAGDIAAEFGGGGHAQAASATIRDMTIHTAHEKLLNLLHERVQPKRTAGEIMSHPVIALEPHQTIGEAAVFLSRYQVSSLPVAGSEGILGILHRTAVDKAVHHGLDQHPVTDYMNPGAPTVTPDTPIEQVVRLTVEGRQRLVPVVDDGRLVGVISRSDLLGHLKLPQGSDSSTPDEFPAGRPRTKSVRRLLEERLPRDVLNVLKNAGDIAEQRQESVYLVGGTVRDLLLRDSNLDIDLVVEGEGIPFARALAEQFPGCRVRSHEKFGTAVVLFPDGFKIDIATARLEYYERPGALPTVETSCIKRDLYRRDFTMNTLAVCLNPSRFGQVLDFFGGSRDIKEKVIRVLHNLAFVEDPTRILRAIRFSSRFGFVISKHTATLIKGALKMQVFANVEGKRIANELIHILEERSPSSCLSVMASYGVLPAIHPALSFDERARALFESAAGVLSWWKYLFKKDKVDAWRVYFLALTDALSHEEYASVLERLAFPIGARQKALVERSEMRMALTFFASNHVVRPSVVVHVLKPLSLEALLFMMAKTTRDTTRKWIADYISSLRYVKPALRGNDLKAMGFEPGPVFTSILNRLRDARLDGEVASAEDERNLIRRTYPAGAE
jgi:tRNA nucleotidyltransferase (CCA-adding enzyme)